MNATLTIQVRVLGAQAASQLGALQKQVGALNAAGGSGGTSMAAGLTAGAGSGSTAWQKLSNDISKSWASIRSTWATGTNQMKRTITSLETQGQGLRRAGQQIMFGFTLPFAIGVGAAAKWALDNERAMTRLTKVYGDFTYSTSRVKQETEGIGKALEALSGRMGLNQEEVITIGSEWAAVGLAGKDLLNATRATTEAMVLGDLDAEQATKSLISIMAVWKTSVDPTVGSVNDRFSELTDTLAIMNAAENATGAQFKDLIDVLQKSSGVAQQFGLDIRDTVALAATLIPSTGTGAQAGNAIKTMLASVMVPTKEAMADLNQIGVDLESREWIDGDALTRLQLMGKAFVGLNEAAKNQVVKDIAGKWQINRFAVMMKDLADSELMFAKSNEATLDPVRRQTTYMKELSTVLESNPKKFEILTNVMKNDFADTMIQLMPVIIGFMSILQKVFAWFNGLSPNVKTFIFTLFALLAILGPILMTFGVFVTAGANLLKTFRFMAGVMQVTGKVFSHFGTILSYFGRGFMILGEAIGKGIFVVLDKVVTLLVRVGGAMLTAGGQAIAAAYRFVAAGASMIASFVATAASAVASAATTAYAWVQSAAVSFLSAASDMALAGSMLIASFISTAATAVATAATTGIAWLASAASAVVAAASDVALAMSIMVASFLTTAAAAVASAAAVIFAWGVAVVDALIAAVGAVVAAIAAIGIPLWVIVAVIAAIVAAVVLIFNKDFRDNVVEAIKSVARWFAKLPEVIGRVMSSVARAIWRWIGSIVDALSYLNPFQRHSPSLVDNVKAGVAVILDEYARLRGISGHVMAAAKAHEAFGNAIAGTKAMFDAQETAKDRSNIASQAPGALPAFDAMVSARAVLQQDLIPLAQEIAKQTALVAKLTGQYDQLDAQLKKEQRTLSLLQRELDAVNDAIDRSEKAIDDYASAGIIGMRAVEDEVFANTLAQNKLKLAIMDLEDAGASIEDIESKMKSLNAEMEGLTGTRQGLYLGGAGSDILQAYDDQIDLIRQQQAALEDTSTEIGNINTELAQLSREAERMELERWITFEPQLRQIQQLKDGLHELPFDEIIKGITIENEKLAKLRPEQEKLNAAVKAQQAIVDVLTLKLEDLKYELDAQQDILDKLETAYSDIEALIADMTSQMKDFSSAAKSATDEAKALSDQLSDGDYELTTGLGDFTTESSQAEIDKWAEDMQAELEKALDEMPNPFDALKVKWEETKDWFDRNFRGEGPGNIVDSVSGWFKRNFSTHGMSQWMGTAGGWIENLIPIGGVSQWLERNLSLEGLGNFFETFAFTGLEDIGWDTIGGIIQGLEDACQDLIDTLWNGMTDWIINPVKDALGIESPSKVMKEIGKNIIEGLVNGVKEVASTVWGAFMTIIGWLRPIWEPIVNATKAAWDTISSSISDAWNKYIFPVFAAIWGFIWGVLVGTFNFLADVVRTVWAAIGNAIKFVWERVIKPVWDAIVNFIKTKIIPIFQTLWAVVNIVWTWIKDKIKDVWDKYIKPVLEAMRAFVAEKIVGAWNSLFVTVVNVWEGIKSVVKSGAETMANFVIGGVNKALGAFRWLSDGIKSLGAKIGVTIDIPNIADLPTVKLAKGGIAPTDPNGGLYAGARAIVGEGSNVWPEYVIPTDPRYRDRARMLAQAAAERVGLLAKGGTVGKGAEDGGIWGTIKSAVSGIPGVAEAQNFLREGALAALGPIKSMVNAMAEQMPMEILKGFVKKPLDMVEQWLKNSNPEIKGDRGALNGWKGKDGSYRAILAYINSTQVPYGGIGTIANRNVRGTNRKSLHAFGRAVDFSAPHGGVDNNELLAIYRAFLPVKDILTELIYSGPGGSNPRNPITAADHHNHVHVGLARGGMLDAQRVYQFAKGGSFKVPHGNGGILARIGEGRNDERVQITPLHGNDGGGDTIIEINGDLSFPNITSGDDAEKLIDNLKALAS